MANIVSAQKDIRRIKRRTVYNNRVRNRVKKATKAFEKYLSTGDVEKAKETLPKVFKVIGKSSKKNIIKKGTASRKYSRMSKKLNKLITASNVKNTDKSS